MRTLILKTWRDITTRKGQFAALIVLVALGIASYVAFVGASEDLKASKEHAYAELKFADFTTSVVAAPSSVAEKLKRIDGVADVEARLVVDAAMDIDADTQGTARIVGIPTQRGACVNDVLIVEGSCVEHGEHRTAMVNTSFAEEAGYGVGDTLTLRTDSMDQDVRIVGVAASPEYMFPVRSKGEIPMTGEFAIVFMAQEEAERLLGVQRTSTDFAFSLEDSADLDRVIEDAEDVLEPFNVITSTRQEDQPSNFVLSEEIAQNEAIAGLAPILILTISALSLYIALSRLVRSQRGEIGLAKALGYGNGAIVFHYLLFSIFIAVVGSIIGFVAGHFMAGGIVGMYTAILGVPYLVHEVRPEIAVTAMVMSVTACLLAGILPAIGSARLLPAEAMHADPNLAVRGGHVPLVERAFGWAMPRTFTFRIPLRNVFRARRRTSATIIGIAFAVLLSVATVSMFDSMNEMLDRQFEFAETWDAMVAFETHFGDAIVRDVESWDGVAGVEAALALPVELTAGQRTHEGAVTAIAPNASFHGFEVAEGASVPAALADNGLVMPESLAGKLEIAAGDWVSVDSPYIDDDMPVQVLTISDEGFGAPFYTSAAFGQELMGGGPRVYNLLYLELEPGANASAIKADLYDLPGASQAQVKQAMVDMLNEMMSFSYAFYGVMLAFGLSMAFVVIYNTFTANVTERTREIASMRTIGEDGGHLATMITIENLMLAIVGIPLGVWLGLLVSQGLLDSMSTEAYSLKAILKPESVVFVTLLTLVVLLLSEIPPARRIFKLDLAEATKMRE